MLSLNYLIWKFYCRKDILVAKPLHGWYSRNMDALDQLEACVNELLARLDLIKTENTRLQAEIAQLAREKQDLAAENTRIHDSLAQSENSRLEALRRVDLLLQKIREHESVG